MSRHCGDCGNKMHLATIREVAAGTMRCAKCGAEWEPNRSLEECVVDLEQRLTYMEQAFKVMSQQLPLGSNC